MGCLGLPIVGIDGAGMLMWWCIGYWQQPSA